MFAAIFHAGYSQGLTLDDYWTRPLYLQGKVAWADVEPFPESCGACHADIFKDWSGALHGRSIGPGLKGQFDPHKNPSQATSCYFCHAPALEQNEHVEKDGGFELNPRFDARLKDSGVSCPVCHLRGGVLHGPLKRTGASGLTNAQGHLFNQEAFFEDSGFCKACHQNDDGYEFNGSPLTNTYAEWEESLYAKNNVTCQRCHMPDRRHLFRGIHDKEMTLNALSFDAGIKRKRNSTVAGLVITNSGAGHYFPTYSTPLVVVRGYLADESGTMLLDTMQEGYIGRKISLDLTKELFDTRIAPLKGFTFEYRLRKNSSAKKLVFDVWVYPDEFYERFFSNMLAQNGPEGKNDGKNKDELKKALDAAQTSHYLLYKKELRLSGS
ncbi:MAG: hypothetical protein HY887_03875 [Deltaproteobacteria bacterium]|nr:hypothetical protein [Deltaproteobacteria bacterium]